MAGERNSMKATPWETPWEGEGVRTVMWNGNE